MLKSRKSKIFLLILLFLAISGYLIINLFIIGNEKYQRFEIFDNTQKQIIKNYIFPYKVISSNEKSISDFISLANNLDLDYGNSEFEKLLTSEIKLERSIKKYIFPYKYISLQNEKIEKLNELLYELETNYKNNGRDIKVTKSTVKLSNNNTLIKYKLNSGFYLGIQNKFPGSGYIDFFEDNIFILSSRGILAFRKSLNNSEENFKQIKTNIDDFIGLEQFKKSHKNSIKDLLISNGKIYISFSEEIKNNCYNTSIISGDINYKNIKFNKLFSNECIDMTNVFSQQGGGRIVKFKDNHILFSVGDYRHRHFAQDKKSINGKILKINIFNGEYEILSMGHRNPQGLYYDKENDFILETEHGPLGGDEINLIEIDNINKNDIQNFGWAISSYGEHYGGKNSEKNIKVYEKFPLYKSHNKHGFIEPLKYFVPSIAISEIVKIKKNTYAFAAMGRERVGDKSIYFFELNEKKKIINLEQLKVYERIRDLKFNDNKLFLFMEDSPSIGVIKLN